MLRRSGSTKALSRQAPFAVRVDRNVVGGERSGEGRARELRALVGIEDVRLAVTSQSILQRLDAERSFYCNRQAHTVSRDKLAPPARLQSVAQDHHGCKVQRRNRGRQIASSIRCRLTPSVTKIRR
jgi:hypothetical protein